MWSTQDGLHYFFAAGYLLTPIFLIIYFMNSIYILLGVIGA